jgi:hypothetical protein
MCDVSSGGTSRGSFVPHKRHAPRGSSIAAYATLPHMVQGTATTMTPSRTVVSGSRFSPIEIYRQGDGRAARNRQAFCARSQACAVPTICVTWARIWG